MRNTINTLGGGFAAYPLTTAEAARIAGVSTATIRRWTDSGVLHCVKLPRSGTRRYRRSDVEKVLREIEADDRGYATA